MLLAACSLLIIVTLVTSGNQIHTYSLRVFGRYHCILHITTKKVVFFLLHRCKLFYKKENEFKEKGVGTLHLKPAGNEKTQLLVRADTNLGKSVSSSSKSWCEILCLSLGLHSIIDLIGGNFSTFFLVISSIEQAIGCP